MTCWTQVGFQVADAAARPGSVLCGHDGVDHDVPRRLPGFGFRATRVSSPGLSSFAQVQPSAPRNQTESKSACERPLRALVRLLQAHSKCCISAQDEGEPRRSAKGRRRDRQKIAAGAAELAAAASLRPQRASALPFFAKKSDCRGRGGGRTRVRTSTDSALAAVAFFCKKRQRAGALWPH